MPKFGRVGAARRKRRARRPTELANAVEGWLAEICRDLALQVKRMRQLHEQADEWRTTIGAVGRPVRCELVPRTS